MADFTGQAHRQPAFPESSIASPHSNRRYQPSIQHTYEPPVIPGEALVPPPPGALHRTDGDAFNVDPNVPYLDSGGISPGQGRTPTPHEGDNGDFVGGLIGGMKRAFRWGGYPQRQYHPEEASHSPGTDSPYQYVSPSPPRRLHPMSPGRQNMTPAHYSAAMHTNSLPPRATGHPNSSPSTSSETAHQTVETYDTHDGDSTAVDHHHHQQTFPAPMSVASPVNHAPELGPDYPKRQSQHDSISSISVYMSRVQKFFHDINKLPWVADRVTVDYFPGQGRSRRRERPKSSRRSVISWYNTQSQQQQQQHPLFSTSSSPSTVIYQVQSADAPPSTAPIAAVIYPSPSANSSAMAYGPARGLEHNTYYTPQSSASRQPGMPVYPNGYMPYQQQGVVSAQYPGQTIHMTQTPAPAVAHWVK